MQFMEDLILVHHLVHHLVVPILELEINLIKIIIHLQMLEIHIFIQIMFIILDKHGKNFQVINKIKILR
jgi:hypothetical protein